MRAVTPSNHCHSEPLLAKNLIPLYAVLSDTDEILRRQKAAPQNDEFYRGAYD